MHCADANPQHPAWHWLENCLPPQHTGAYTEAQAQLGLQVVGEGFKGLAAAAPVGARAASLPWRGWRLGAPVVVSRAPP